ncbi:hypothetical protein N657DRAFT_202876 [Parathielavia appendiculata]|uniref:Uncharacterized protein n=1 Tax=Parathielavia appendiculata TaxID=2587402 RepID=A0AAN6Z7B6_9PEZI|nr:hypothetical protein N657DRAFT_202876 [Parathielavia appendiculata]
MKFHPSRALSAACTLSKRCTLFSDLAILGRTHAASTRYRIGFVGFVSSALTRRSSSQSDKLRLPSSISRDIRGLRVRQKVRIVHRR